MGSQCEVSDEDKMVGLRIILVLSLMISLSLASLCQTSRCRNNFLTATVCCNSGKNFRCCDYSGGGGRNNNKPGSCPPYHGRRRRSPERTPGTMEGLDTTLAIITTRADVSETVSVPGLSSVAIYTEDISAPHLSTK